MDGDEDTVHTMHDIIGAPNYEKRSIGEGMQNIGMQMQKQHDGEWVKRQRLILLL